MEELDIGVIGSTPLLRVSIQTNRHLARTIGSGAESIVQGHRADGLCFILALLSLELLSDTQVRRNEGLREVGSSTQHVCLLK